MIELLYERVSFHKDKFISPILHSELETLEVDKHGKVQAIAPHHDDQVFSYLHALRVWYEGENVAERYGLQKNVIKTDEDVEIDSNEIDSIEKLEKLDIESTIDPEDNKDLAMQQQFFKDAEAVKLQSEYNKLLYEEETKDLNTLLTIDKDFKKAYNKKYHVDDSADTQTISFVDLPDGCFGSVYDNDEEEAMNRDKQLHGNLYSEFTKL